MAFEILYNDNLVAYAYCSFVRHSADCTALRGGRARRHVDTSSTHSPSTSASTYAGSFYPWACIRRCPSDTNTLKWPVRCCLILLQTTSRQCVAGIQIYHI